MKIHIFDTLVLIYKTKKRLQLSSLFLKIINQLKNYPNKSLISSRIFARSIPSDII